MQKADKDAGLSRRPDDAGGQPYTTIIIEESSSSGALPAHQSSTSTRSSSTRHARNGSGTSRPPKTGQQASPSPSTSQPKTFEFVLVTDNESRRQVRRHAMRQYMHQRRLDSIARLGPSRVPASGWTNRLPSESSSSSSSFESPGGKVVGNVDDEVAVTIEEGSPPGDEERHAIKDKGKRPSRLPLPKQQEIEREDSGALSLVPKPKYSDPQVFPKLNVLANPFCTYPVPISDADNELIQHFVVTYPTMMYKFAKSSGGNMNPMVEIFRQLALHDDLPFQAMLAIASKHRAGVEGKADSVESLTHKMRTLRLINERIHLDSKEQRDGIIYAVATMAVIEKWSQDPSIERMHFRGLASMIRNRGGMQAVHASNPFLEKLLYWVDTSCAPKAIVGTALPWTGFFPDRPPAGFDFINPDMHLAIPHNSNTPESIESLCDQFRSCEDFLRFFRVLHELERTVLNSPSSLASTTTAPRRKSFSPGTRLHSILTLLPDHNRGVYGVRFIDEYSCMSCLFFLAVALHYCYSTSTNFDVYVNWLDGEIQCRNAYDNPSITSILWLFLQNGGFGPPPPAPEDDPNITPGARCWLVSRMVRIAKHLEWKRQGTIWDSLRQVLIDFLVTQQECALGAGHVDAEVLAARARKRDAAPSYFWDEDVMRREILDVKIPTTLELETSSAGVDVPILT